MSVKLNDNFLYYSSDYFLKFDVKLRIIQGILLNLVALHEFSCQTLEIHDHTHYFGDIRAVSIIQQQKEIAEGNK